MSPLLLFSFVIGYFILLLGVAYVTSRNSNNESFFIGNRSSNWMLVAFGMIGTSLSGVTFVSVPGGVGGGNFYYFQIVLGYLLGYMVIAFVLIPLYYRMNLTSIYTYLERRFGINAHKAGAFFFHTVPCGGGHRPFIPCNKHSADLHLRQTRDPL